MLGSLAFFVGLSDRSFFLDMSQGPNMYGVQPYMHCQNITRYAEYLVEVFPRLLIMVLI